MKKLLGIVVLGLLFGGSLPVSAFVINDKVYLNACGSNPQEYKTEPLNIHNVIIEVPNKIISLEKSKYDRPFQTYAESKIILNEGNDVFKKNVAHISLNNFRDVVIKDEDSNIITERKVTGATSLYEITKNEYEVVDNVLKLKKKSVVAWGVGWHKYCKESYKHVDFTVLRLFIPVVDGDKFSIQQQVVSLNLNETYKIQTILDLPMANPPMIFSDAVTIPGSAGAFDYHYMGSHFFKIDNRNGFKYIDDFKVLRKKLNLPALNAAKLATVYSTYNQFKQLERFTKNNFDEIYDELQKKYWANVYYKWDYDEKKYDNYLNSENNNFPLPEDLANIKQNCINKSDYKNLEDLIKNCYFWHSSLFMDSQWGLQNLFADPPEIQKIPWMGIRIQDNELGAYIASLDYEGPAYKSGLMNEDIIVAINNEEVKNTDDLIRIKSKYNVGDEINLKIIRNNQVIEKKLVLGEKLKYSESTIEIEKSDKTIERETFKWVAQCYIKWGGEVVADNEECSMETDNAPIESFDNFSVRVTKSNLLCEDGVSKNCSFVFDAGQYKHLTKYFYQIAVADINMNRLLHIGEDFDIEIYLPPTYDAVSGTCFVRNNKKDMFCFAHDGKK